MNAKQRRTAKRRRARMADGIAAIDAYARASLRAHERFADRIANGPMAKAILEAVERAMTQPPRRPWIDQLTAERLADALKRSGEGLPIGPDDYLYLNGAKP